MTAAEIEIFDYSGREVRTVIIDGEPWFVVTDVCRILGHSNPSMALAGLDDDEKGLRSVETLGGEQLLAVVSEPGLYSLILRSRKPEAKAFRRWVTHEVLPSIRRTGQFGSQLPTTFAEALELAAAQARSIEAAEAKIALDAPKVAAYDALMDADGYYSMEAASKILGVGRTTLFRRLREAHVLMTGSNLPYQRYAHHFKVTASTWTAPNGSEHTTHATRVRPSGLEFIGRKLGLSKSLVGAA